MLENFSKFIQKFSGTEKRLRSLDLTIVSFSTIANIFMVVSTLIFAVPEKYETMAKVSKAWILMQLIASSWKLADVVYSTLPRAGFVKGFSYDVVKA